MIRPEMAPDRETGLGVKTSPISAPASDWLRPKSIRLYGPRRLVFGPSFGVKLLAGGSAALLIPGMAGVALNLSGDQVTVIFLRVFVFVFLVFWTLALPERLAGYDFDRDAGHVCGGSLWKRQTRPLGEILALQVISGGWHENREGNDYELFQLNLVFDDESRSRLCLSQHKDRARMVANGRRLSEFLEVPLLDDLSTGRTLPGVSEERGPGRRGSGHPG